MRYFPPTIVPGPSANLADCAAGGAEEEDIGVIILGKLGYGSSKSDA